MGQSEREIAIRCWAECIRAHLKQEGITQKEFAEKVGIDMGKLRGWLTKPPHQKSPTWEDVVTLTRDLHLNPYTVLYGTTADPLAKAQEEIATLKKAIEILSRK